MFRKLKINLIPLARRILIRAFRKDGLEPGGFRHGYVANIACVIHDNSEISMEQSSVIANRIMKHIFV